MDSVTETRVFNKNAGLTFSINDVNFENDIANTVEICLQSKNEVLSDGNEFTSESLYNNASDNFEKKYEAIGFHWWWFNNIDCHWRPFSILDSNRIERTFIEMRKKGKDSDCYVATDGGRFEVSIEKRQKNAIYWSQSLMEIRRASWYYRTVDQEMGRQWQHQPYSEWECEQLEQKYQQVLEQQLWHQSFEIDRSSTGDGGGGYKFVFHSANTMAEYRWASAGTSNDGPMEGRVVYRGVEGFRNHLEPGEGDQVDHLVLVVPGTVPDQVEEIIDRVQSMRRVSGDLIKTHCLSQSINNDGGGRVEFLPVCWQSLHSDQSVGANNRFLSRISLKSVRKLRQFSNSTLSDTLRYSNPDQCQSILSIVSAELNRLRHLFASRNPHYEGPISIVGHGLGAAIVFDLARLQLCIDSNIDSGFVTDANRCRLEFELGHVFCLGSPAAFLAITRSGADIDQQYRELLSGRVSRDSNEGWGALFNIFHPFDPVAYRVEPMLVERAEFLAPVTVPHHKGRKRMHLELKENLARVSQDIGRRLARTVRSTWQSLQGLAGTAGALDFDESGEGPDSEPDESLGEIEQQLTRLNAGRRIDHVLQEAPLESFNDYLFALGSHSCYWQSEDTVLMVLRQIYSTLHTGPDPQMIDLSCAPSAASVLEDLSFHPVLHSSQASLPPQFLPPIAPLPMSLPLSSQPSQPGLPPVYRPVSLSGTVLPPTFQNISTRPFFQPGFSLEDQSIDNGFHEIIEEKVAESESSIPVGLNLKIDQPINAPDSLYSLNVMTAESIYKLLQQPPSVGASVETSINAEPVPQISTSFFQPHQPDSSHSNQFDDIDFRFPPMTNQLSPPDIDRPPHVDVSCNQLIINQSMMTNPPPSSIGGNQLRQMFQPSAIDSSVEEPIASHLLSETQDSPLASTFFQQSIDNDFDFCISSEQQQNRLPTNLLSSRQRIQFEVPPIPPMQLPSQPQFQPPVQTPPISQPPSLLRSSRTPSPGLVPQSATPSRSKLMTPGGSATPVASTMVFNSRPLVPQSGKLFRKK